MSFGKRPGPKPIPGRERRRHIRRPIGGPAEIVIPSTGAVISCQVIDASVSGARLAVATVFGIPSNFQLRLPTGVTVDVEVIRKSPGKLGVQFKR